MKNFFCLKILFIFCMLFLLFSTVSNASSISYPSVNVDNYQYFILFSSGSNTYLVKLDSMTDLVVGHGRDQATSTVFYLGTSNWNYYLLSGDSWVSASKPNSDNRLEFTPSSTLSMINTNFDMKYDSYWASATGNQYYFTYNRFKNPYIANTQNDLSSANFKNILILPGSFKDTDNINFVIRKVVNVDLESGSYESQNVVYKTVLNSSNIDFFRSIVNGTVIEFWYEIPQQILNINFINGDVYLFTLEFEVDGVNKTDEIRVTIGGLTDEDKLSNSLTSLQTAIQQSNDKLISEQQKTQQKIEEQTEVQKNIFSGIGDILGFLNPFSDKFFGKVLVELIINGFKTLFIPEDNFFSNYFTELKDWFSDRLGFLFYPFEVLIDLLNKMLNINFSDPVIHIPDISEPFTNIKLISAIDFDFNSLLLNEQLKVLHDIYFILIDAVIVVGLVNLLKHKCEEVMTK